MSVLVDALSCKRRRVNTSFDVGTLSQIDLCADALGVTRSRFLVLCFRFWLDSYRTRYGFNPWDGNDE